MRYYKLSYQSNLAQITYLTTLRISWVSPCHWCTINTSPVVNVVTIKHSRPSLVSKWVNFLSSKILSKFALKFELQFSHPCRAQSCSCPSNDFAQIRLQTEVSLLFFVWRDGICWRIFLFLFNLCLLLLRKFVECFNANSNKKAV